MVQKKNYKGQFITVNTRMYTFQFDSIRIIDNITKCMFQQDSACDNLRLTH